jgi:TfoX/Sxy family transcriptional regulator of competence genes
MAYDDQLAARIRKLLERAPDFTEKKMFGGICFLLGGHMCCGVVGPDLMVRVDKTRYLQFLADPFARPMTFTGREMRGMLFVGPGGLASGPALSKWVRRAREHAQGLPSKSQTVAAKPGRTPSAAGGRIRR